MYTHYEDTLINRNARVYTAHEFLNLNSDKIYINMQWYLSYKPTYPRVKTKFTSTCSSISQQAYIPQSADKNLHEYATVSQVQAYIPQSADKLYLNMQQYFRYKLTYPRVQAKIYMNMQHYLSYKPTYPRVQTNFIITSICSNRISATSLHTMHMHSADPYFPSLTENSARNQQCD